MEVPKIQEAGNFSICGRVYCEENPHTIKLLTRANNKPVITIPEGKELVRIQERVQAVAGKGVIRHEEK